MPAYVIVDVDVKDTEPYKEYRAKAAATVQQYGGRYLVRGGAVHHVEPGWDFHRFAVLEFPSVEQAKKWYTSPEYAKVVPIRKRAAKSRLSIVEGLDPTKPLPA